MLGADCGAGRSGAFEEDGHRSLLFAQAVVLKLGRLAAGDQPAGVISGTVKGSRATNRPGGACDAKRRLSPSMDGLLDRGFI